MKVVAIVVAVIGATLIGPPLAILLFRFVIDPYIKFMDCVCEWLEGTWRS